MTRRERLLELAEKYYLDRKRSYSGAEDFDEYMEPEYDVKRFCAITRTPDSDGGDFVYFYPDFDTQEAAQTRGFEHIVDSIYEETPTAVVDLDLGDVWLPVWDSVVWDRPGGHDWWNLHKEIRAALEGDSNDAEHDALVSVADMLGITYKDPDDNEEG